MGYRTDEELETLLRAAAQMGAAIALQQHRQAQIDVPEWVPKEEAMKALCCSYSTLNRLVKKGVIRRNEGLTERSRKYYSVTDINKYLSGSKN